MNDDRFWCLLLALLSRHLDILLLVVGGDGSLETELKLSLGGTDECFEDLRVVRVEGDVAAGGVGEALEDDGLLWFDG